jgi:hypothetical protein
MIRDLMEWNDLELESAKWVQFKEMPSLTDEAQSVLRGGKWIC